VVAFFAKAENIATMNRLKSFGVQLEISAEKLANQSDTLQGQTFVVSGVFEMPRNDLKKLIEDNGGKVSSSISAKTSYVVAGDKMGPSKLEKAKNLGVKIISEEEFIEMLS